MAVPARCTSYALLAFVGRLFYLSEEVAGKNEVVQLLVCRVHHVVLCAFPLLMALINKDDVLADSHYRVHVVRVNDGGNIILFRDF